MLNSWRCKTIPCSVFMTVWAPVRYHNISPCERVSTRPVWLSLNKATGIRSFKWCSEGGEALSSSGLVTQQIRPTPDWIEFWDIWRPSQPFWLVVFFQATCSYSALMLIVAAFGSELVSNMGTVTSPRLHRSVCCALYALASLYQNQQELFRNLSSSSSSVWWNYTNSWLFGRLSLNYGWVLVRSYWYQCPYQFLKWIFLRFSLSTMF